MLNINNVNFLSYNGVVTLKLINLKTKKVKAIKIAHNNGTKNLFNYLCNALAGNILSNKSPKYIDACENIFNGDDNTLATISSSLAYRVTINKSIINNFVDDKDNTYSYVIRFSTIIPYSTILSGSGGKIQNLLLHSSQNKLDKVGSLLAYLNLDTPIIVEEGQALLIEWNMGFKNPTSAAT